MKRLNFSIIIFMISDYNINIGWSNDQEFDIDLDQNIVRKLLSNINSNKASGPDGIHGKITKKRC